MIKKELAVRHRVPGNYGQKTISFTPYSYSIDFEWVKWGVVDIISWPQTENFRSLRIVVSFSDKILIILNFCLNFHH